MEYFLDARKMTTKEEAYAYLQEALHLPDYLSTNLDSLWDILGDKEKSLFVILHGRLLYRNLSEYGLKILDLFGDLHQEGLHEVVLYW